jgi:pimeloyl-ACP methyl ester carboxylesterase
MPSAPLNGTDLYYEETGGAPAFDYGPDILHNATWKGATPRQLAALGATPADDAAFAEQWRTILPLYFHHYDPAVLELLFQETRYSAAAAVRGNELLRHYNLLLRLSELHTPTLILAGRDDFITPPRQAERLAATLPNARLIFFERSDQYPWIEEPDQFFPIVHGWLAETAA